MELTIPIIFIIGDQDQICDVNEMKAFFPKISSPKQKVILNGVDHFLNSRETKVGEEVTKFFSSYLGEPACKDFNA